MPNAESFSKEELDTVRNVMALFSCDRSTAEAILEASQMNGTIGGIMNMCNNRKEHNHA